MMKGKLFPTVLAALAFPLTGWSEADTGLFAFSNGVPQGIAFEEEAVLLKELAYSGVSQIHAGEGGEKLAERVAAYDKHGVKVLSIYLEATAEPIDPEIYKAFRARGGMIELTVRKPITPEIVKSIRETAETAGEMGIRVALYPHFGFTVATVPQALELAEKVDHPNLGIMFNLCHFLKSEEADDLEKVLQKAAPRLFAVSTNGADEGGKDWTTLIRPLDEGDFSQKRLFKALADVGFDGPVGLQCYNLKGERRANLERSIAAWEKIQRKIE